MSYKAKSMSMSATRGTLQVSPDCAGGVAVQVTARSVPLKKSATVTVGAPIFGGKSPA